MTYTTNYNFPKYEATDTPDLIAVYNAFADLADATIKEVADAGGTPDLTPTSKVLVSNLAALGITAAGIVVNNVPAEG